MNQSFNLKEMVFHTKVQWNCRKHRHMNFGNNTLHSPHCEQQRLTKLFKTSMYAVNQGDYWLFHVSLFDAALNIVCVELIDLSIAASYWRINNPNSKLEIILTQSVTFLSCMRTSWWRQVRQNCVTWTHNLFNFTTTQATQSGWTRDFSPCIVNIRTRNDKHIKKHI